MAGASVFSSTICASLPLTAAQLNNDDSAARVLLRDGRQLSYSTYGTKDGWPVLYFHGIPTSRIEARFFAAAAAKANIQLIAINRPGIGNSDFQCGRTISSWVDDVLEFVNSRQLPDSLDLNQFSIASFSSGAAYALACASQLPSGRLRSIGVVSGIAPLEKICGNGGVSNVAFRLANKTPKLVKRLLVKSQFRIKKRPTKFLNFVSNFFGPCDRSMFSCAQSAELLADSYLECLQCGPQGVAYDMSLLSQAWDFRLEDICCPVGLFYGDRDKITPLSSMGECLDRALPCSTLNIFSNQGHLSMLDCAGEQLFKYLLSDAAKCI